MNVDAFAQLTGLTVDAASACLSDCKSQEEALASFVQSLASIPSGMFRDPKVHKTNAAFALARTALYNAERSGNYADRQRHNSETERRLFTIIVKRFQLPAKRTTNAVTHCHLGSFPNVVFPPLQRRGLLARKLFNKRKKRNEREESDLATKRNSNKAISDITRRFLH